MLNFCHLIWDVILTQDSRQFLNKVFSFIGVGLALYCIARFYEWMSEDPIIQHTVKCAYCRKWINVKVIFLYVLKKLHTDLHKAKRCVNCTSWQDGREDKVGGT